MIHNKYNAAVNYRGQTIQDTISKLDARISKTEIVHLVINILELSNNKSKLAEWLTSPDLEQRNIAHIVCKYLERNNA